MSSYVTAGENFEKICSDQALISSLVEIYSYYFKLGAQANRETQDPNTIYKIGTYDGAVRALEAIMLEVLGGRATYEIYEQTKRWAHFQETEEKKDE